MLIPNVALKTGDGWPPTLRGVRLIPAPLCVEYSCSSHVSGVSSRFSLNVSLGISKLPSVSGCVSCDAPAELLSLAWCPLLSGRGSKPTKTPYWVSAY